MEKITDIIWDIIVIGGGPAGMMAAGRAAEKATQNGQKIRILLIEKNDSLGKKLLITGGGRCNVTNAEFNDRAFLEKFKGDGKFLFSAFSQYSVQESLDFFNNRGMATKVEAGKRVFPVSDKAQSVWDVLVGYLGKRMEKNSVTVMSNSAVTGFVTNGAGENTTITAITLKGGNEIRGKRFILATGGKSRPETGSTGDGFKWLAALGHTVIEPTASLVPVKIREEWVKKLAGVTLPEIKIKVGDQSKKGKILFTHFGISGPTILNMSRHIGELLEYDEYENKDGTSGEVAGVEISLDLLPRHDYATLNAALQDIFKKDDTKKIKNALAKGGTDGGSGLILSALVPIVLEQTERYGTKINPDTTCNGITREERLALVKTLKDIRLHAEGLLGTDKAIVTSGGVALDEVDFRTMQSRLVPNLHLTGDILNIDRPSGGYSLQLCWTTGWVGGTNAADSII